MIVFALGVVIGVTVSVLGEQRLIPPIGTTQPVADNRYVNESGDTMTGNLVVPNATKGTHAMNQNLCNSTYVNVDGDTMTGTLAMPAGSAGAPSIVGPDADTGFYWSGDGKTAKVAVDGADVFSVAGDTATFSTNALFPAGSTTEPSIVVYDLDTGFAYSSKGQALLALVDGVARAQFDSTGIVCDSGLVMGAPITRDVDAGLTASTTQTQGQGALTAEVNEVATCANNNDTVTLPTAAAGLKIIVINNGAKTLRIFPASGDDLGAGVDTSTTLSSGSNVAYQAYDATNWESM
jgi:hypothetical protein